MVKPPNLTAQYDADLALTAAEPAPDEGMPTPEAVSNIISRPKEPPPPRFRIRDIPLTVVPTAVCKIRPRHAREAVADMAVTVYPAENRLLLAMPPESSAVLKEGLYTADIAFTRVSDGLVQMSGDIAVEILKGTSNAG